MPRSPRRSIGARLARSRVTLIAGACIALFLLVGFAREVLNRRAVNEEISSLEQQIAQLEKRKQELSSYLGTLTSPLYQEQEAREKLGLARPGETVVIVPLEEESSTQHTTAADQEPNPVKWWRYFFASS